MFKLMLLFAGLTLGTFGFAAEKTPADSEAVKLRTELQQTYSKALGLHQRLQKQKKEALVKSARMARHQELGLLHLRNYLKVIESRYIDDQGEYQNGFVLSQKDRDNINELFTIYLNMKPFSGRISAGQALRFVSWGIETLEEWKKNFDDPDEQNNSELEIITKELNDAEATIAVAEKVADRMGVELSGKAVSPDNFKGLRQPAFFKQ